MNRISPPITAPILMLLAFLWPWEVYLYIPVAGFYLTGALAVALIAAAALDLVRTKRRGVPFELLWPVVVLAALVACLGVAGGIEAPLTKLYLLALFLSAARFANPGIASACLKLTAIAGAGAALHHLLTPFTGVPPTGYSLETGVSLACAWDVSSGALALALGACAAGSICSHERKKGRTAAAVVLALIPLSALMLTVHRTAWPPWTFPYADSFSLLKAVAFVILAWLLVRIVAKLIAAKNGRQWYVRSSFIGVAALPLSWSLLAPLEFQLGHALLLGLAAVYASSAVGDAPAPRLRPWLLVPAGLLVALNLWTVYPSNTADPRNYDVAARKDLAEGRIGRLRQRMDHFESIAPGERKTHYWRALAALDEERLQLAAGEFALSVEEETDAHLLLPPPSLPEREDFLMRLRDASSQSPHPEHIFAFERALVAIGEDARALGSLRQRIQFIGEPEVRENVSEEHLPVLRNTVGFLLSGREVTAWPSGWTAAELLVLLKQWGAEVTSAPDGMPSELLPLSLIAQHSPRGNLVATHHGPAGQPAITARPDTSQTGALALGSWSDLANLGDGWRSTFALNGEEAAQWQPSGVTINTTAPFPDAPMIRIWLP